MRLLVSWTNNYHLVHYGRLSREKTLPLNRNINDSSGYYYEIALLADFKRQLRSYDF